MNRIKQFIFVAVVLLGSMGVNGQKLDTSKLIFSDAWTETQKTFLTSSLDSFPNQTEVSIAIINGDKTEYLGIKNENGVLVSVENQNANYEIGSISKVFTSTLLAKAILRGDVSADTDITELIGYPLKDSVKINLQQLSNHTSGLARMPQNFMFSQIKNPDNPYSIYDEKLLKEWITQYMDSELDQTTSEYSNLGVALLAHGISKKYNKTYDELLKSEIFVPLGMKHSTTNLEEVKSNMIPGLNPDGSPASNWTFDVLAGAGAIISTISDLEIFANKVISGTDEALNLQKQPTFKVYDYMEMGLAWHIIKGKDGNTYYFHNGATGGYTSSMLIDIDNSKVVIMLTNISYLHPKMNNIDTLVFGLMRSL